MKILHVTRQYLPFTGGIEVSVHGLGRALQRLGHTSEVLSLRKPFGPDSELLSEAEDIDGVHVSRVRCVGSNRYPIAPSVLSRLSSFDVVHVHAIDFFVDYLSATRAIHRKPLVVTTHGGFFHTEFLRRFKEVYFRTVTRATLAGVHSVICVSQSDHERFAQIVPSQKLHVIPNGVSTEPFVGIQKDVRPGLLVGIGRVVENKRIDHIIRLLPALSRQFSDVHLMWIGPDREGRVPSLLEQARQLGVENRVTFRGQVSADELTQTLTAAHLFVSASAYEGFGISTVEAMLSSTVPVVTPVGVHPEVIQPARSGFICDFEGPAALDVVRSALSLSPPELAAAGARARESAMRYAWAPLAERHLGLYDAALRHR